MRFALYKTGRTVAAALTAGVKPRDLIRHAKSKAIAIGAVATAPAKPGEAAAKPKTSPGFKRLKAGPKAEAIRQAVVADQAAGVD